MYLSRMRMFNRIGECNTSDSSSSRKQTNTAHSKSFGSIRARFALLMRGSGRALNRINLVLLWHMHQPQYRDPESGRYVLPWTRLHAIKDYWGMVRVLQEAPKFHATFNVVPSLGMQIEEYASGKFDEPWFSLAFKNTDDLTRECKA